MKGEARRPGVAKKGLAPVAGGEGSEGSRVRRDRKKRGAAGSPCQPSGGRRPVDGARVGASGPRRLGAGSGASRAGAGIWTAAPVQEGQGVKSLTRRSGAVGSFRPSGDDR
jgi:hypothetical protein